MPSFDFITDEDFRRVLEADLKEIEQCLESKAWKAVHVLAGSIIEAVLIDYLIAEKHLERDAALKMNFGRAIELAAEKGIISKKLSDLSSAIKEYRNLIHPGRSIRTREAITGDSANVAISLVQMILTEIEGRKRSDYGYTAEQIVSKIEQDPSVEAILKRLLQELNQPEMERLLLKVVPEKYMTVWEEPYFQDGYEHLPRMLPILFRTVYEQADCQLQARVAQNFVRILLEGTEEFIRAYSRAFFRMSDLQHLPANDAQAVKEYFFAQIKNNQDDSGLILALSGIGKHLLPDEISSFVDPLVRTICSGNVEDTKDTARRRIVEESMGMEFEDVHRLENRLNQWSEMYRSREESEHATLIEELKLSIGAPF